MFINGFRSASACIQDIIPCILIKNTTSMSSKGWPCFWFIEGLWPEYLSATDLTITYENAESNAPVFKKTLYEYK